MVRLPPSTSVLPVGKGFPNLVQLNFGGGKPSASQVWRNVECSIGVTSQGRSFVKIGRPTNCIASVNEKLKVMACVKR